MRIKHNESEINMKFSKFEEQIFLFFFMLLEEFLHQSKTNHKVTKQWFQISLRAKQRPRRSHQTATFRDGVQSAV